VSAEETTVRAIMVAERTASCDVWDSQARYETPVQGNTFVEGPLDHLVVHIFFFWEIERIERSL